MIKYIYYLCLLIVFAHDVSSDLPSYVHLHTLDEIAETSYVLLDKPELCKSSGNNRDDLLIAIKTAPGNRDQRNILRQSWLIDVMEHRILYIFVLGATIDERLTEEILIEDRTYNDLIIGKPVDNYYNLTLKGLFLLAWTNSYCYDRWLLYVDDDSIINVKKAINFMTTVKNKRDRVIYCQPMYQPVIRNPDSKWFIPRSVWKHDKYPTYCSGNGYLIPPSTLLLLYRMATNSSLEPKLWVEDAFITGIVTQAASIKLISSPFRCCMRGKTHTFHENILLGQMGKEKEFLRAWESLGRNLTNNTKTNVNISISMVNMSRFDRRGHILTVNTQNNENKFQFIVKKSFTGLESYSFLLLIASVIIIMFLYSKKPLVFCKGGLIVGLVGKVLKACENIFNLVKG